MQNRPTLTEIFPLPAEAKRLNVFLGNWRVKGTLTFMSKPCGVKGCARFSSIAARWGVLATAKLEIEGLGTYEEADLLAFDRNEKLYHFFSVTNTAAAYDHKGQWLYEDTISFIYEGLQDGKSYREELLIKILNQSEVTILEKDFVGNQITTEMNVSLRKDSEH
jgi:hypothetical protein